MALKVGELFATINLDSKGFDSALSRAGSSLLATAGKIVSVKKLIDMALGGIKYNAEIEQLQTSFEVMSGSAEIAAATVEKLRNAGAATPYETADLARTVQLMMNYGFAAEDAYEQTMLLSDIAQGDANKLTSIATGYAQMSSAAKVNLQDIKQMINGGFNPLQEIAETTGETMESLYDRISKGQMDVLEIQASIIRSTREGGKYYQSNEKQQRTLNGQISTLKDNWKTLTGELTKPINIALTNDLLPSLNNALVEITAEAESGGLSGAMLKAGELLGGKLAEGFMDAAQSVKGFFDEQNALVTLQNKLSPENLRNEQRRQGDEFNADAYIAELKELGAADEQITNLVSGYKERYGVDIAGGVADIVEVKKEETDALKEYAAALYDDFGADVANFNAIKLSLLGMVGESGDALRKLAPSDIYEKIKERLGTPTELAPGDFANILRGEIEKFNAENMKNLQDAIGEIGQIDYAAVLKEPIAEPETDRPILDDSWVKAAIDERRNLTEAIKENVDELKAAVGAYAQIDYAEALFEENPLDALLWITKTNRIGYAPAELVDMAHLMENAAKSANDAVLGAVYAFDEFNPLRNLKTMENGGILAGVSDALIKMSDIFTPSKALDVNIYDEAEAAISEYDAITESINANIEDLKAAVGAFDQINETVVLSLADPALAESASSSGSQIGENFSAGIANGIRAGIAGIIAAATEAANAASAGTAAALDEHSPSRVGYGQGMFYAQGIANGILGGLGAVASAVSGIGDIARNGLSVSAPSYGRITPQTSAQSSANQNALLAAVAARTPEAANPAAVGSAIADALIRSGALSGDIYLDGTKVGQKTAKPVKTTNDRRAAQTVAARGRSEVTL